MSSTTTAKLQTQLCTAVKGGQDNVVRKLLEESGADPSVPGGDDPVRPPIWMASRDGRLEIAKLLLGHAADPNQARTTDGTTPVFMAAQNGHTECLQLLLKHAADPNLATTDDGSTPACMAAHQGHTECLQLLLKHAADPNLAKTTDATTPAYMASQNGHAECLQLLLEHAADPNLATTDDGSTPAHGAAGEGNVECLQLLLEHAADPNQATTDVGTTPLHTAACEGKVLVAQLLVVHGANMAAVTAFNDTPFFYATQNGHQPLADWLNAVATWSPLRVAAALRMHACIALLLQQGRLDPDDRVKFPAPEIMAAIAASTAMPAELPWENALPTCHRTIKLVCGASFGWKYSTHRLYHANVKKAVFAVLAVADRLERGCGNTGLFGIDAGEEDAAAAPPGHAPLPLLPPELWLFIMHFFQRSWWRVGV
eukprot:gene19746-biopygen20264